VAYIYISKDWFYNDYIKDVMTVIKNNNKAKITLYSEDLGNRKQDEYWLVRNSDYTCLGKDYAVALETYQKEVKEALE
jgi:hypothetical protein